MAATKLDWGDKDQALLERLRDIRTRKDLKLPYLPKSLKAEIPDLNGDLIPFNFRYYQIQGILSMIALKRMVLGDGTGLGKCITLDTLIPTSRGTVPFESLVPEDCVEEGFYPFTQNVSILTAQGRARIKRFYWGGKKPTLKVITRNGYHLEGSLVHPILVRREEEGESFVRLCDLKKGDYVCVARNHKGLLKTNPKIPYVPIHKHYAKEYTYPSTMNIDLATLLGYIVAEGYCTLYGTTVTQYKTLNPEPHAEIRRLFKDVFGWEGNQTALNKDVSIHISSVRIRDYLRVCGIGDALSAGKEVPWCVLQGSREVVRNFLSAFIEAECSVELGGIEVTSASQKLLDQVQQLLLQFGVISTRSPKVVKGYEHNQYWRLTFFGDSARVYQKEIGLRSTRKALLLSSTLTPNSNPNKDLVPHMVQEARALKALILRATSKAGPNANRKGSGLKQFGESFRSTLKNILLGGRNPSYPWLKKFLSIATDLGLENTAEYEAVQSLVTQHYFYDPIVEVVAGENVVCDLEIDDPSHCFVGNGFVNHNTIQTVGVLAYLWDKNPNMKTLIVAPKSAIGQWGDEIHRFMNGVTVFTVATTKVVKDPAEHRKRIYEAWQNHEGPAALIINYSLLIRDWNQGAYQPLLTNGQPDPKQPVLPGLLSLATQQLGPRLTVILDEATAFKSRSTKTWETVSFLCRNANRAYALTATLLKNRLIEGYNIYGALIPGVFTTQKAFHEDFCYVELKKIGKARIPIIKGYKNLDKFRERIELVYLGRPKHEVSSELPTLATREVSFELNDVECAKYKEALSGVLSMGDGDLREFESTKALTSLIYCQQVVNSLALLKFQEGALIDTSWDDMEGQRVKALSSKEEALVDLLTEELEDEKVIIYTRFASHVPRLQAILKKHRIESVAITGKQKDVERKAAQKAFQDLKSKTHVIFITAAGSEAINLQAAAGLVFFDMPWSWGDYVQILGRMIRIGSPHKGVLCFHLIAKLPGKGKESKTIDHHVLSRLRAKKGLIDQVLGEAAVGALQFEKDSDNAVSDLLKAIRKG